MDKTLMDFKEEYGIPQSIIDKMGKIKRDLSPYKEGTFGDKLIVEALYKAVQKELPMAHLLYRQYLPKTENLDGKVKTGLIKVMGDGDVNKGFEEVFINALAEVEAGNAYLLSRESFKNFIEAYKHLAPENASFYRSLMDEVKFPEKLEMVKELDFDYLSFLEPTIGNPQVGTTSFGPIIR